MTILAARACWPTPLPRLMTGPETSDKLVGVSPAMLQEQLYATVAGLIFRTVRKKRDRPVVRNLLQGTYAYSDPFPDRRLEKDRGIVSPVCVGGRQMLLRHEFHQLTQESR